MKISPFKLSLVSTAVGVTLFIGFRHVTQAQAPSPDSTSTARPQLTQQQKAERAALDKSLKIVADPKATSSAKTEAVEQTSELSPDSRTEAAKLALVQPDSDVAYSAFSWLFGDGSADDPTDGLKRFRAIQAVLPQALPEIQYAALSELIEICGIQTSQIEDAFHETAKNVIEDYLKQDQLLNAQKSEALSGACLLLALSPRYDDTDRVMLLRCVALTQMPNDIALALALAYRGILTQPRLAELKQNSKGKYDKDIVMQVVSAVVDETAKKKLIGIVNSLATKKYTAKDEEQLLKSGKIAYINLLRFVDFPEKKKLIESAYLSGSVLVKKAAALVASENYPQLVIQDDSLSNFFQKKGYDYQYASLLAYLALRHPNLLQDAKTLVVKAAKASNISTPDIWEYDITELKRTGIVSSYDKDTAEGFNGVKVISEVEVDYNAP